LIRATAVRRREINRFARLVENRSRGLIAELSNAGGGFTMNFSLRTLLIFMAAVAVVSASLVSAAPIVGDLFHTLGLVTIPFVAIGALYQRGPQRAQCIGFLIVFASYFFHTVWQTEIRATWAVAQRAGDLDYPSQRPITTRMLSFLFLGLHGEMPSDVDYGVPGYDIAMKFIAF
jgi:hypothetical protein